MDDQGKKSVFFRVSWLIMLFGWMTLSAAWGLPTGPQIRVGAATIHKQPGRITITQEECRLLWIDWETFNIHAGEEVLFSQPDDAIVINRVVGSKAQWTLLPIYVVSAPLPARSCPDAQSRTPTRSTIAGLIVANARVLIANSAGISFGSQAEVNAGGFVASGLELDEQGLDQQDASGLVKFLSSPTSVGDVNNQGQLNAHTSIILVGGNVINEGRIMVQDSIGPGHDSSFCGKKKEIVLLAGVLSFHLVDQKEGIGSAVLSLLEPERNNGVLSKTGVTNRGMVGVDSGNIRFISDGPEGFINHRSNIMPGSINRHRSRVVAGLFCDNTVPEGTTTPGDMFNVNGGADDTSWITWTGTLFSSFMRRTVGRVPPGSPQRREGATSRSHSPPLHTYGGNVTFSAKQGRVRIRGLVIAHPGAGENGSGLIDIHATTLALLSDEHESSRLTIRIAQPSIKVGSGGHIPQECLSGLLENTDIVIGCCDGAGEIEITDPIVWDGPKKLSLVGKVVKINAEVGSTHPDSMIYILHTVQYETGERFRLRDGAKIARPLHKQPINADKTGGPEQHEVSNLENKQLENEQLENEQQPGETAQGGEPPAR